MDLEASESSTFDISHATCPSTLRKEKTARKKHQMRHSCDLPCLVASSRQICDRLDFNQAVTRDECRAYLVWRRCFSPVFLTNLLSISWRRGESIDTRLLILRNLLQTYERKNRTTRCMPASYVQNHVQRNRVLRRCSSTQVLRRLLYLYACFFGASIRCVPGPCSIQWKARATTFCRHGNSLGAFIGGSSLSRR